jgi:hypothetical protein
VFGLIFMCDLSSVRRAFFYSLFELTSRGGGGGEGGGKSATILKTTAKSERRQVQQSGPAAEAVQKELFRGLHQSARS